MTFFFQAEDGIRDGRVTGVQTCALPISTGTFSPGRTRSVSPTAIVSMGTSISVPSARTRRSEERRVGKECRSRWAAGHEKKKDEEAEHEGGAVRDPGGLGRRAGDRRVRW